MIVREATNGDVEWVANHLRPEDYQEQFALRFDDDPDALARDVIAWRAVAIKQYALCNGAGVPAIIVGAYLVSPLVAHFHMMSTDGLLEIGREGHRWGRRRFIPAVLMPNCLMAETRILADHEHARRWVRACGFQELGTVPRGKRGEIFAEIVWINPEVGNVRRWRQQA